MNTPKANLIPRMEVDQVFLCNLFPGRIYECNQNCACGSQCFNRVVQNGIQLRLQVFKTENRYVRKPCWTEVKLLTTMFKRITRNDPCGSVWNNYIDRSCVYGYHQSRLFTFRCCIVCCLIVYSCVVYYLLCLFFRGWGLRSLDDIPMGTFVCTYAGQILNEDMANKVGLRDFISLGLEKCLHVKNLFCIQLR